MYDPLEKANCITLNTIMSFLLLKFLLTFIFMLFERLIHTSSGFVNSLFILAYGSVDIFSVNITVDDKYRYTFCRCPDILRGIGIASVTGIKPDEFSPSDRAFERIARRLTGEDIDLICE